MLPNANANARANARELRRSMPPTERRLWHHVRAKQVNEARFRRQVAIDPYIADFACLDLKLIIELDGSQHSDAIAYDEARTQLLERLGFRVLRFSNRDVFRDLPVVLDAIWQAAEEQRANQSRRPPRP
jgi:very-short-patch-repair endonuclease